MKALRIDRLWFALTAQERLIIGVFLLIVLIGLTVKYLVLKEREPDRYVPEHIENIEYL
ncbi:MAG: hypothetical protein KJ626_02640 [Verrucomicrobia bacterium]|nr:hypothetical protein [Verrucomicrobiota bacterium]